MSVHLGLHWGMVMNVVKKAAGISSASKVRSLIVRAVVLAVCCFGGYALIRNNIADYLLMRSQFCLLYTSEAKLNKVLDCQERARKEYLNDIMKYLEIPLYIYSGKLIQTHHNGLGIFCFTGSKENALTEFKMTTDKKEISKKLDVSNKFSTGQKNVANIALMLALKKIAATNLDVFMIDDPCQSLDELNIASFVEIIKNEFTKTQIILSTHEDKIASYIKYKIDKMGKEIIMFNVHNKLYDVQN